MLKFGALLGVCLVFSQASAEFCYSDVGNACSTNPNPTDGSLLANCNAKYGYFENYQADLQTYANAHIQTSFEFLLMSTHFGNYEANREGFKALYRKLSDENWNNAIDIIKFITKRGGMMNFSQPPHMKANAKVFELNEMTSLAKALDTVKQLAEEALRIHTQVQHHSKTDASIAHYIEEKFIEDQANTVRNLAGHTNDFKSLLGGERDASVSVYLFDEYLKTIL